MKKRSASLKLCTKLKNQGRKPVVFLVLIIVLFYRRFLLSTCQQTPREAKNGDFCSESFPRVLLKKLSRIHIVYTHILVNLLSVVLLFLLNVIQGVAELGTRKLKNRNVVKRRNVLFHSKSVLAKKGVVLFCVLPAASDTSTSSPDIIRHMVERWFSSALLMLVKRDLSAGSFASVAYFPYLSMQSCSWDLRSVKSEFSF